MRSMTVLVLTMAAAGGCSRSDEPARQPATAPPPAAKSAGAVASANEPTVVFETSSGSHRVAVEVARTPSQLSRGLMYRRHMPWDRGMLFIFDREEQQSFWMKNTLIPLDMVFVRKDMSVLGVVHQAEPRTLTPRRVEGDSTYVVEVNGGWARDHGVEAGTQVRFENLE